MILSNIRTITALIFLLSSQISQAETLNIPLKIDFPLLHKLVITQLFTDDADSKEILQDSDGCSEIVLSDPKLSELKQHLQINTRVSASLAIKMINNCVPLLKWSGYAKILAQPAIHKNNKRVIYLRLINSQLFGHDKRPIISGPLWEKAKKYIHPFFDQFHYDLSPSIAELRRFLPLFLTRQPRTQLDKTLDSLHLGKIDVTPQGIVSQLVFDVETIVQPKQPEQVLNQQEQRLWQKKWQSMDALLTQTIKFYASATELHKLRMGLFDILMDARYKLQDALQQNQKNDPVRHWFIDSWSKLIPLIQQISLEKPQYATAALMTTMTASDALLALDKLGPAFGFDISIEGLRRLARLINKNPDNDLLNYDEQIDPQLIQLFQLHSTYKSNRSEMNFWPVNSAFATDNTSLNNWIAKDDNLNNYLKKVRKLLLETTSQSLEKSAINAEQRTVFKKLVLATAWQESCWRQYVVDNNKIVPLRSSTGDTGIMQVNETIWRGFLDKQKLRWDIAYNIKTGSKILLDYMTRYAIKQGENKHYGGLDNLARSAYSTYNGGPGQVARYRKNNVAKQHQAVDKSFYNKYLSVKQGKELTVVECLGGRIASKKEYHKRNQTKQVEANKRLIHNKTWIKRQAKNHFSLQLGVFSSQKAAKTFIKKQNKTGNYAIYKQHNKKNQLLYTVIYGLYSTHVRAKKEAKLFKQVTPWIRQFKDIKKSITP